MLEEQESHDAVSSTPQLPNAISTSYTEWGWHEIILSTCGEIAAR